MQNDFVCKCGKKYKYEGAFNKHKDKCLETSVISNIPALEINKKEKDECKSTVEQSDEQSNNYISISNIYKNEYAFMKWVLDFRFVNREFKKRAFRPLWMYNIRAVHEELLRIMKPNISEATKTKIVVKKDKKIIKSK